MTFVNSWLLDDANRNLRKFVPRLNNLSHMRICVLVTLSLNKVRQYTRLNPSCVAGREVRQRIMVKGSPYNPIQWVCCVNLTFPGVAERSLIYAAHIKYRSISINFAVGREFPSLQSIKNWPQEKILPCYLLNSTSKFVCLLQHCIREHFS